MSITRDLSRGVAAAVLALWAGSCGAPDADLVVDLQRGGRAGELDLYVCGEAPTSKCKHFTPFAMGSTATSSQIGIFVDDDTQRLELQLQLQQPAACARFLVTFAQDKAIQVQLDASGAAASPYSVSHCGSCSAVMQPCTYPGRE
jgi:hypothetical protein